MSYHSKNRNANKMRMETGSLMVTPPPHILVVSCLQMTDKVTEEAEKDPLCMCMSERRGRR